MAYTIYILPEGFGMEAGIFQSAEEAAGAAQEWVNGGQWDNAGPDETITVAVCRIDEDGDRDIVDLVQCDIPYA